MPNQHSSGRKISRRRLVLVSGMLAATIAATACSTPAAATTAHAQMHTPVPPAALATVPAARPAVAPVADGLHVEIGNFNFTPAELVVPVGSTVTWTNTDDAPHTVTSTDKTLNSPSLNTDGQFSFTFTSPGTYAYFCAIHPFMTGKVVVQ